MKKVIELFQKKEIEKLKNELENKESEIKFKSNLQTTFEPNRLY